MGSGRVGKTRFGLSGFRGHRGGRWACVVSSAQLWLVGGDPARKDLSCGFLGWVLFPQFQFLKKRAVTFGFGAVKVVEKAPPATDHGEEAAA